jgi:hypothetical protein
VSAQPPHVLDVVQEVGDGVVEGAIHPGTLAVRSIMRLFFTALGTTRHARRRRPVR